jgi:c-di-GMP-binding flagellar brake protein YcgR
MASSLQRERRRFVRVPFDCAARAEQIPRPSPDHVCRMLAADISEDGVRLSSPEFLPLESLVLLDLDTPSPANSIRAVGRVAWAEQAAYEDRWRVGVQFSELSDDARSQLRSIIRRQHAARSR